MVRCATEVSDERVIRDQRALIWTVKSLTNEIELEPFVESIPDALWGPNGRRLVYDNYILALANDAEVHLVTRIENLLRSCESGLLKAEIKERRQITCLKALWAIASLADPTERTQFLFDLSAVYRLAASEPLSPEVSGAVHQHALSVYALIQWHSSCAINSVLHEQGFQLDHIPNTIRQMIVRLSKREAVILDLPPLGEINFSPPTGLWATMAQNWIPPVRAWDGEIYRDYNWLLPGSHTSYSCIT
jgi:hypothetical protein